MPHCPPISIIAISTSYASMLQRNRRSPRCTINHSDGWTALHRPLYANEGADARRVARRTWICHARIKTSPQQPVQGSCRWIMQQASWQVSMAQWRRGFRRGDVPGMPRRGIAVPCRRKESRYLHGTCRSATRCPCDSGLSRYPIAGSGSQIRPMKAGTSRTYPA